MNRTVLLPHQVSFTGFPVAMSSKLLTLNATAWTRIGKRRVAATMERRAVGKDMMSECECDIDGNKARYLALSMPLARRVTQDFRRGYYNGML